MMMKMKNGSNRHNINSPRSRHIVSIRINDMCETVKRKSLLLK